MRRKIASSIAISLLMIFSLANAENRFDCLDDLTEDIRTSSTIIMRPDGGYIVLWEEYVEGYRKERQFEPPHRYYFYRVVDAEGKVVVRKKEIEGWRLDKESDWGIDLSSKSIMWLDGDKLLILAWRLLSLVVDPPVYRLERLILSPSGEILSGPDVSDISMDGCELVKDQHGRVYAVQMGIWPKGYVNIAKIYPTFKPPVKMLPLDAILEYSPSFYDNVVTMTSQDNLLVVIRRRSLSGTPRDDSPEGWVGLPNHLMVCLLDLTGNLVGEIQTIDLSKDAFRKVPGIHLGGYYSYKPYKAASRDFDLTRLPNNELILSATDLDADGELCVYQVRFSDEGLLQKSESMKVVKPKTFPKDGVLPILKAGNAVIGLGPVPGKNKTLIRRENILFGFDEDGNFYSEREIWRVKEEN